MKAVVSEPAEGGAVFNAPYAEKTLGDPAIDVWVGTVEGRTMRFVAGASVLCLLLIMQAGLVYPSDDSPASASAVVEKHVSDRSGNLEKADFTPSCTCCDVAYMDTFKNNQLLYARTPEFLEAVRMVASGNSKYSPRAGEDIPFAQWKAFAMEMRRHPAADALVALGPSPSAESPDVDTGVDALSALSEKQCMIPALIYLASLEYRSRSGQAGIRPIFPRILRAAVAELDGRLTEKRRMAEAFAKRAAAVRSMIAEAERTVASKCSPDELVRAKSELERACRDALGVRSSLMETDMAFARAEKVAGLLRR